MPGWSSRAITTAWSHPVECGECGLDFAEFDAVAADLDLLISAPQILQLPVGAPAHQVAGAIHPRSGFAERACQEAGRAQPGPAPIANAHTAARDIQFADHPGGYRA